MPFQFFRVPVSCCEASQQDLNQFLSSHRVICVDRQFVNAGESSFWAVCIDYLDSPNVSSRESNKRSRIDYREVLSDTEFAVFSRLRDVRKTLAENEGVRVYAVFTNQQLAEIVQQSVKTKSELKKVSGLGEARIDKYGNQILTELNGASSNVTEPAGG